MVTAIFGISNDALNLVVNLLILMLVVVWLALVVYTFLDARRRVRDPFLVGCATLAALIPYVGTAVYAIVRPPEFLEDAHERELEIKAAELRVRQLTELSCPDCEHPVDKDYLRCPQCQKRLKDPCPSCGRPVAPSWALCPFCEEQLQGQAERPRRRRAEARPSEGRGAEERRAPRREERERKPARQERKRPREEPQPARGERKQKPAAERGDRGNVPDRVEPTIERPEGAEKPKAKKAKRSKPREPDPDPRQA